MLPLEELLVISGPATSTFALTLTFSAFQRPDFSLHSHTAFPASLSCFQMVIVSAPAPWFYLQFIVACLCLQGFPIAFPTVQGKVTTQHQRQTCRQVGKYSCKQLGTFKNDICLERKH